MKTKLTIFCCLLVFFSAFIFMVACKNNQDESPPVKDTTTVTKLNEHNEYTDENGYKNDICFTQISKYNISMGEKEPFIKNIFILEGYIEAQYFSFELEHAYLEVRCNNIEFCIAINIQYSCELSDTPLTFNDNKSKMKGNFKLAFLLEGENAKKYESISESEINSLQFCFHLNYWGKDKAKFIFNYSEMVLLENINIQGESI